MSGGQCVDKGLPRHDFLDAPPDLRDELESNRVVRILDMKKRFTEAQIIGFLREADAGMAIKELCRRHGFSEARGDTSQPTDQRAADLLATQRTATVPPR